MATTHRENLPGAYPESNPATPNEQGLAPQNQSYTQAHDQRNKLHMSADPRSHFRRRSSGEVEAFGGGYYDHGNDPTMFNSTHPRVSMVPVPHHTSPLKNTDREPAFGGHHEYTFSKPVPTTAKEQAFRQVDSRPEARRESEATSSQGADEQLSNLGVKSSNDDSTSHPSDTSGAAPYWGDLPKASSQGGIYNTVTGHGSARDDHDEHHHLPQRSAQDSDDRLHITGLGTDVPSGGVYNTVAGHGSNDEESRRHLEDSNNNNNNLKVNIPEPGHGGGATINSTDAVFDAPLAAVPEHRPLASDDFSQTPSNGPDAGTATGTDRKDLAPGSLPEPAAADDAKLLAESAARRKERAGSTDNTNVFDAHAHNSSQNSDVKPQRAFPLTSKHATTADTAVTKDDAASSSNQPPLRHKEAFAAGAAGLGAGALAKKHADDGLRDIKEDNAHKNLGEDTLAKEWDTVPENLDHPAHNYPSGADTVSHRRKSQELSEAGVIPISGSTLEKIKNKEEEKPLGEDTLDVWDTTPENLQKPASRHAAHAAAAHHEHSLAKEPSPAESRSSEDSPSGEKKHHGLLGIFHRHKDDKDAAANQNQRKSLSGPSANQPTQLDQKRRASDAAPSSHHRNPSDAQSSIPVPTVGAASTNAPSHGISQAQREHAPASKIPVAADHSTHDKLNSNTARAGMAGATLAGVAGGIGAAKYASAEDNKETIQPEQNVSHANPEHPRHAHSAPTQHAADFSATPSGVKPNENLARNTAQEPGYNVLMSGTPSGAQPMSTRGHFGKQAETTNEPGNYNKLASGTPSGVDTTAPVIKDTEHKRPINPADHMIIASGLPSHKSEKQQGPTTQQPSARRASEGVERNASAAAGRTDSEEGPYNKLASGTPSGVKISPHHSRRSSRSTAGPAELTEPVTHADHQDKDGIYRTLASGTATGVNVAAMHNNRDKAKDDVKDEIHEQSPMNALSAKQAAAGQPAHAGQHPKAALPPAESQSHQSGHSTVVLPTSLHEHKSQVSDLSASPIATTTNTQRRTQDHYKPVLTAEAPQQFMSPEVMPDVYTTSVPGRNSGAGSGPSIAPATTEPMRAKHMSPNVMPSNNIPESTGHAYGSAAAAQPTQAKDISPEDMPRAYTASAPGHSGAEKINNIPESTGHAYGSAAAAQPTQAKDISPEDMPRAYTASAPGHSGAEKINNIPESTGHPYGVAATQPSQAKDISPEQMPSAYTASAPGHSGAEKMNNIPESTGHAYGSGAAAQPSQAKDISPEEMPGTYTASAPGHSGAEKQNQKLAEPEISYAPAAASAAPRSTTTHAINPALAAASGAWAAASNPRTNVTGVQSVQTASQLANASSSAGKQQGVTGIYNHKPVLHKCQHCGQENDVSEVVETALKALKGEGELGRQY
ncbi:hypothetical protein QBC32DRAFT_341682 [Pseudoneurospora amorphoporcata]|uniref:Uncharacterized protein n=1 Tax=Pseudoneurospora amorphoporcata TaxID=241081 RepID=A0AAN6NYN2_9PEZI|nr:hypothetical protein QBC32DRAFT_341682 [Pseudoneurospora amorphoporcata]